MSLLSEAMKTCVMLNETEVSDGRGGHVLTWTEGTAFEAAVVLDSSIQAKVALASGVTGIYTVTTSRSVNLQYHDVFRRGDGMVFRVTSNGDDKSTPESAALDMRCVSAEEWTFPTGDSHG